MLCKLAVIKLLKQTKWLLILLFLVTALQAQDLEWAKSAGATSVVRGSAISVDGSGNSYVSGDFQGTATYGPGEANEITLTSSGGITPGDIFVAKYNSDGELQWAKRAAGNPGGFEPFLGGIAVDGSGNSYVTGACDISLTFNPGDANEITVACEFFSFFLAKYDSEGDAQWVKHAGQIDGSGGRGISVDGSGNIYVTGTFEEFAIFGRGEANETTLTAASGFDIFVAKYNSDGDLQWAKRAGGGDFDTGSGVVVDGSGSSYVTGSFTGTATFGPGEANETTLTAASGFGIFVAKYNSDGDLQWAKSASGAGGSGIAVDGSGNSYVTGEFFGTATFGTGESNETTLTSSGSSDIFLAKYDSAGDLQWAKRAGGTSSESSGGIAVDGSRNSYVTGDFSVAATFGPGEANETTLTAANDFDIFVAKYNSDGDLQWARRAGGAGSDRGRGIAGDGLGSSYVTGEFGDTATFGAGEANETTFTAAGFRDTFVAKYGVNMDYGDAPDPLVATAGEYPTLQVNNGARHVIPTSGDTLRLGSLIDSDSDGQPSTDAGATAVDGDDGDGTDDEDGVVFITDPLIAGEMAEVEVTFSGIGGKLDAWIDFNVDGDWDDVGEQIADNLVLATSPDTVVFAVPDTAGIETSATDITFARFRLSSVGGLTPTGVALDGEVEDYQVEMIGKLTLGENGGGQATNAFDGSGSVTSEQLFRFSLTARVEASDIGSSLTLGMAATGIVSGDFANLELIQDTDNNGVIEEGESAVGTLENPLDISDGITFSNFIVPENPSGTGYILRANVNNLTGGDRLTISLPVGNITNVKGATSEQSITPKGSVSSSTHIEPGTLTLAENGGGQASDAFDGSGSVASAQLFQFALTASAEAFFVDASLTLGIAATGIVPGDFANLQLIQDLNNDGVITGGDVDVPDFAVGIIENPIDISDGITFSNFIVPMGTTGYILTGVVSNLAGGDVLTVSLPAGNITDVIGATSGKPITPTGSVSTATHAEQPFLTFRVERSTGNVFATGSFIPDGADLAERINVSEPVEPGDVIELDPTMPGSYRKARSNSQLITGIITTDPGVILGNNPGEMDAAAFIATKDATGIGTLDRPMLALIGRVPVKVTTENGPINAGDLLTVSSKPGYAMRCAGAKECEGAIIGKALQGLESGKGLILVLVMSR